MKKTNQDNRVDGPTFLDGGWGWVVVIAGFLSQTLIGSIYFGYGVLLPEWINEFDSSSALTSFIGGAASGLISGSGPISSFLIHKWGCRATHVTGGVLLTVAFIGCSFAQSMVQIFILYSILGGIGGGLCYVPSVITISKYFKVKRSIAIGIVTSGCGCGAFVFPVIFEYLMQQYGWRGVMLIVGAINGNMIAFGMIMCPVKKAPEIRMIPCKDGISKTKSLGDITTITLEDESLKMDFNKNICKNITQDSSKHDMVSVKIEGFNRDRRRSSFQIMRGWLRHPFMRRKSSMMKHARQDVIETTSALKDDVFSEETTEEMDGCALLQSAPTSTKPKFRQQAKSLLTDSNFYNMFFHNFTMFFGMMIVFGLTPLRASVDFGMTASQSALLLSEAGFSNLFGRFLWGFVAAFKRVNTTYLFISLRLIAAALTLVSPMASSFELQMTYCAFAGLLFGNWSIYPIVVADQFGDELLTVAFGFLEAANGLGSIVGPLMGGYMYDVLEMYKYSFVLSGSVLIAGVIPLLVVYIISRNTHKRTSSR